MNDDASDNAFGYMANYDDDEKIYSSRMDHWLMDTFLNASGAPRNNRPWFNNCIAHTLERVDSGNPVIIGLTGLAGSGKDSAIGYLVNWEGSWYRTRVTSIAFADPLKKIAEICGFTKKQLYDRELKEKVDDFWRISPRQFLQMCGTEMFRKVWRDDIWVKLTEKKIRELVAEEREIEVRFGGAAATGRRRAIFVTDVRFPNEAAMIKQLGGFVVRIERPDNPNRIDAKHDSERFIEELPVDTTIINDCKNSVEWSWKFTKDLMRFFHKEAFYFK